MFHHGFSPQEIQDFINEADKKPYPDMAYRRIAVRETNVSHQAVLIWVMQHNDQLLRRP